MKEYKNKLYEGILTLGMISILIVSLYTIESIRNWAIYWAIGFFSHMALIQFIESYRLWRVTNDR